MVTKHSEEDASNSDEHIFPIFSLIFFISAKILRRYVDPYLLPTFV